jgi:hypothetical protein
MDSPVGVRDEICHEFGSIDRVLAEPGYSFLRPLFGHGHGGLGCDVSCRVPTHPICHNPDAAAIQEGQRILVRRANMTSLGSTDSGPLLGLCHGATSIGFWRRTGGNPTEGGPNRVTIWS